MAADFFKRLQDCGLGDVGSTTKGNNKHASKTFRKRKYEQLEPKAVQYLEKVKVSKEAYN